MNNIAQKNVIYNLSVNSELPYQKANQVSLKANQIIYTAINHAFDKMVDNDLYNEKAIFSNASYTKGPKPEATIDVGLKSDGYKIWPSSISSPESDLSILHKNVLTLQQSLSTVDSIVLLGNNYRISSIVKGEQGYLITACHNDSLEAHSGQVFVTTNINNLATFREVKIKGIDSKPHNAVEIDGTIYLLMPNGVRKITSTTFDEITDIETEFAISGVSYPTTFEIYDGKYLVGNSQGLSTLLDDGKTCIRICDDVTYAYDIKHCGNIALAATDDGIYQLKDRYTFLTTEIILPENIIPTFTYSFGLKTFVATDKGLYVVDGNTLNKVGNNTAPVTSFCEFNDGLYVGFDNQNGVSKVIISNSSNTIDLLKVSAFNQCSIKGLGNYNNNEMLVAATAGGIYYATPNLQKKYLIESIKNSTKAIGTDKDVFVANQNTLLQVSSINKTFFEPILTDALNIRQFLGNYAIDDTNIYKLNSAGRYERDPSFESFSASANGISRISTADGRNAYVIYGNSTSSCIQVIIDGTDVVLKYDGMTDADVISVFNLAKQIVIATRTNSTSSSLYLIPIDTFFDNEKYSSLTFDDSVTYLINGKMTSIGHDDDHIFYVVDRKLYAVEVIASGKLDNSLFLNYSNLSSAAIADIRVAQNAVNLFNNNYDIVCWQTPGKGLSAVQNNYVFDDTDPSASYYMSKTSPFAVSFPSNVVDSPLEADVFDFLMSFQRSTDESSIANDQKHYGAQQMGSHTFIAASSKNATAISAMSINAGFNQLSNHDVYFAPEEDVAFKLTTCKDLKYAFADCTLDPDAPTYNSQRQLDCDGNVARYEFIGYQRDLSALYLSPAYKSLPAFPTGVQIYKQWALPLDRDFVWDVAVSSYFNSYPAFADVLFAANGTAATYGLWQLKQNDASFEDIEAPTKVFNIDEDIVDVFSYQMSINSSSNKLSSSCTYDLICYSELGISSFQYFQKLSSFKFDGDIDESYVLSVGNIKNIFSSSGIKHVSMADSGSMYVLSTYTYVDEKTSKTLSASGIAVIRSSTATLLPALSTGINAFEIIQTSAIIASGTDLCVIADIDKKTTTLSISASDVSRISTSNSYISSKKFYKCANKELSEFAVFYNNRDIAVWSNNTYDASKKYKLSTYTAMGDIRSLQLNESRHNYLPSITYIAGNAFNAIQSENTNTSTDSIVVDWKHCLVNIGTANISNIKAYSYFNDVFFFGGSIVWSDASTSTSKSFMPDYQLSCRKIGRLASETTAASIRNITVDYTSNDTNGNKNSTSALVQVFIATDHGLYHDYLSVGINNDNKTYIRKELSAFSPTLLSSDIGVFRQFSALSAADIQSAKVYDHTLYLVVHNRTDVEFPYYVYSSSLSALKDGFDNTKNEVDLVLEYKIPAVEVSNGIKLCEAANTLACLAYKAPDDVSKLYTINTGPYIKENDVSGMLGHNANTIFQVGDIPFKADDNGISAILAIKTSDDKTYALSAVGNGNIGNVQMMSYSDNRFYASGNNGLSTFEISRLGFISAIPELQEYSLCANNGMDAFSLSGQLSGIYVPQTYSALSVVSIVKFPDTITDVQADNRTLYIANDNNVSSLQIASDISDTKPAPYLVNGKNVEKVFAHNDFVLLGNDHSLIEITSKNVIDKPCKIVDYIGNSYLFGADDTSCKAYSYQNLQTLPFFIKALSLPASYQLLFVDSSTALVAGCSGVSAIDLDNLATTCIAMSTDISASTRCLVIDQTNVDKWTGKVVPKVIAGTSTDLLSSENIQTGYAESSFLTLSSDIYSVFPIDCYTYLVGTDKDGLYCTSYQYVLSDDFNIIPFSTIDSKIRNAYSASIREHIDEYHQTDSAVTYINNNVMPIDMSKISDTWQTIDLGNDSTSDFSTNYKVIENDIVESIDYGDAIQHIKVEYSNILTQQTTTVDTDVYKEVNDVSYICKKWKSGLIDLFINIPTTNTYYFPHTLANDPCYYNTDLIERQNFSDLSVDGNVDDVATTFRVTLYKKYFGQINNIVNIELNAQSLPLALYKDKTYDDSYGVFFHSCVMPSLVLGQELYNDKIVIKCKCFGSDAQALHILADVTTMLS